jgi:serine/threonine protein kinase
MRVSDQSQREQRLYEVLLAYVEAAESGRPVNRAEFLDCYHEFTTELTEFFATHDRVEGLAAPLRSVAQAVLRTVPQAGETPAPGARGEVTVLSSAFLPGQGFGEYELLEQIGQGGMSVVYKALQMGLNRLVAVKMLRAGAQALDAEIQRFRNEAEAAAQLDHPHIVPIYDVGEQDGRLYFSMKLMEGGNLIGCSAMLLHDLRAIAGMMTAIGRAVHHAHQRGVLHRDLKPSNILLDADGSPHVADFGLARRVEIDSSLTRSGELVGTPSYMAPEQATGRKGEITTATDVYGLGAVLYTLLVGQPPFRSDTVLGTLAMVKDQEPVRPRTLNRSVHRDLETICMKCLKRPRTNVTARQRLLWTNWNTSWQANQSTPSARR